MDAKTRKSLLTIFAEALEIAEAEQRNAFVSRACGSDEALRRNIEELLQVSTLTGSFLPEQPRSTGGSLALDGVVEFPAADGFAQLEGLRKDTADDLIGRYKLLEKIGEGGCGIVYLAEQEEPVRRKVALKVIKLGMDTKQVIARFEAERQALAMMDHPNIAKVFDAGATETGRPYFVMELVRGIKITDYCDEHQLSTRERLELFIQVCQAVQHAHQKGIIHRDLKPSNILVTANEPDLRPCPKVIDFGIAKATIGRLTDQTLFTAFEQFLGTPAYMSPEQAVLTNLDIDTRGDIYSLGVLLYELLTGKTPFDTKALLASGMDEMRRTIREKEPARPSTCLRALVGGELATTARSRAIEAAKLIHLIGGDLDWIVMKCLEKDRTRRYETANGLVRDVQRHLDNEPVVACPPTAIYRFRKLARRHKLSFAATGSVISVLIIASLISTWQAIRATHAEREQRRLRAEAVVSEQRARQAQKVEATERQHALAAQLSAQKSAYAADMLLAFQASEKGRLGELRELLDKYIPTTNATSNAPSSEDLRGWEWRYLWKASLGSELFTLRGHSNEVYAAYMLPGGHKIISAGFDRTIKVWDTATKSVLETIPFPDRVNCATVSADGRLVAVGGESGYWGAWDIASRQEIVTGTNLDHVLGIAFDRQSSQLAVAADDLVEIWNLAPLRKIATRIRNPVAEDGYLHGVAFSPDGRTLAYGNGDLRILLYDLGKGSELELGKTVVGDALSLAFSPDGRTIASSDRGCIAVWDVTGRSPPRYLTNHLEQIACVSFSPDGKLLASASGDQTIRLWDTGSWEERSVLRGHEREVRNVTFSPDGKYLISSGQDETVRIWNVERPVRTNEAAVWPGGSCYYPNVPIANRLIRVCFQGEQWDSISFLDLHTLTESEPLDLPDVFRAAAAVAVSGNAAFVAMGLKNGEVQLWSTEPLQKLRTVGHSNLEVTSLALGGAGRWLAVGRSDQRTELWDLERNQILQTLPPLEEPTQGAFHYDALSFWSDDKRLVRATPPSKESPALIEIVLLPENQHRLIRHTHKSYLSNFALSPDGGLLATCGWDGQITLWDIGTGRELFSIHGQLIAFSGLCFSPDASRFAAGGWDGTITLWDLATRRQVGNWKAHEQRCEWVHFIEDARTLVSGRGMARDDVKQTRLWRAPSWEEIHSIERTRIH